MAQAVHVGSNGKELRRGGMHAPKRPEELVKWYTSAAFAVRLDARLFKSSWTGEADVRTDKIIFTLSDESWLVIDRTASALGI